MLWRCKQTCRQHPYQDSLQKSLCAEILLFFNKITFQSPKRGRISAKGRGSENPAHLIVSNETLTVAESPSQEEISVALHTVKLPTSELSVFDTFLAANRGIIESMFLMRGKEQFILGRAVAKIHAFVPFHVLVNKFWAKPVHLLKTMVMDHDAWGPHRKKAA